MVSRQPSRGNEKAELPSGSWPSYFDPNAAPSPNVAAVASLPTTIVEERKVKVVDTVSTSADEMANDICSGALEGSLLTGGASVLNPRGEQRAWDFPLSGREKADRAVLVGMKEAELAEAWAEVSDRRAQRYCLEASELQVENDRLRDLIEELQIRAAPSSASSGFRERAKKGSKAAQKAKAKLARRRRWSRFAAGRLQQAEEEAYHVGALEAKLRWATEQLAEALQENARLRCR